MSDSGLDLAPVSAKLLVKRPNQPPGRAPGKAARLAPLVGPFFVGMEAEPLGMITSVNLVVDLGDATLNASDEVFGGIEARAAHFS